MRKAIEALIHNAKPCENWSLGYHRLAVWKEHKAEVDDQKVRLGSSVPEVYPGAFKSWHGAVEALPGVQIVKAETVSPLAFGLGDKNVYETGLTLSHTYGVPMLPGSSVKGAMRRAAADLLGIREKLGDYSPEKALSDLIEKIPESEREKVKQWATLFGSTEGMAAVTVHDAWFKPAGAGLQPLMKDVVTVHHPKYYQEKANKKLPPSDMDDPNPIMFWSVKPGVEFWFPIQGPDGWREAAVEILKVVLKHYGLGAKTNAGYGLFKLDGPAQSGGDGAAADEPGEEVTVTFDRYKNQDAMVKEGGSMDAKLCTGCPPGLQRGKQLKAIRRGRGFIFKSLA